jgi:hypothetical protein
MKKILDKPGFISVKMGSERLRNMFQTRRYHFPVSKCANQVPTPVSRRLTIPYFSTPEFAEFNPNKLSRFALACMCGNYDVVKEVCQYSSATRFLQKTLPLSDPRVS